MCGIVATFNSNILNHKEISECKNMLKTLEKRGPDATNFILHDHLFLGHTRLSIIDTRVISNQPFSDFEENLSILFNGEIYNYEFLKEDLLKKGYKFKTTSDTEVVLNLYKEYNTKAFGLLRGMFSILFFDKQKNEILIVRDSVGIKPLYYYFNKKKLIVSSQVKTLTIADIEKEIDFESKIDFYLMGYIVEPKTIFKNIKSLKSGSYMKFKLNEKESIELIENEKFDILLNEKNIDLSKAIDESIRYHLVSDVEVGLFLSSGIDSNTIATYLKKHKSSFVAANLAFKEYSGSKDDESIIAQMIAKKLDFEYLQLNSNSNDLKKNEKDFFSDMDQPTIDGLNTWTLCNLAKKTRIKVFLSGLGLDELLFGYRTREYLRILKILRPFELIFKILSPLLNLNFFRLPRKAKYFHKYLSNFADNYVLKRSNLLFEEINFVSRKDIENYKKNSDLYKILNEIDKYSKNFNEKIFKSESNLYMKNMLLRDSDWAGMSNSLEIRVPFADYTFRSQVSQNYHHITKINKEIVLSFLPNKLKNILKNKKKIGFNIPKNFLINENKIDNIKYSNYVFKNYIQAIKS